MSERVINIDEFAEGQASLAMQNLAKDGRSKEGIDNVMRLVLFTAQEAYRMGQSNKLKKDK